ncbi:hypothetical protein [Streptomyces sp. NPDC051567]|uniref:hypothetical protein n=1 Tax=Streptomyces sp. NPDC051567 TaxID=3365660 RepID=UPI0037B9E218
MTDSVTAWQAGPAEWSADVDVLRYFDEVVFPVLDRKMAHLSAVSSPTLALAENRTPLFPGLRDALRR